MKTKTLQITEKEARGVYKTASTEFKKKLENCFGAEILKQDITERIKTYEDACEYIGIEQIDVNELLEIGLTEKDIAYLQIRTITKALNEGWKADIYDSTTERWYPWFNPNGNSSSFAFRDSCCANSSVYAGSGAGLCFKNKKLATYAGKQFVALYKQFIA